MLFARERRPSNDVLREVAAETERLAVTSELGPAEGGAAVTGIEVLRDGMTYDLVGSTPGAAVALPTMRYRLGVPKDVVESRKVALALQPGPHLAAGARTVPVVRTMMGIAAMIAPHLPGLRALAWPPAGTLIGPEFFVSSMTAWLAGGAFPALGLTAFAADDQGWLASEGLAYFTGQELRIPPELTEDRAGATRLGVRLVNQLVGRGRVREREGIIGPEGDRLVLEPSADGRHIAIRRG